MQTPFHEQRSQYKPEIPNILKGIKTAAVKQAAATSSAGDVYQIHSLFPSLFGQNLIHFETSLETYPSKPLTVGIVLSGGQAPGGHNVIAGVYDALKTLHPESKLYGFLEGPSGIVEGKMVELTAEKIAPYRNSGGFDLIGSGRTKIETEEQLKSVLNVVMTKTLDGLIVVGGDDSNTNAAVLAEYFNAHKARTKVIGVPKTIDGDLKNAFIEASFGFDTATKVYSELISNIAHDAVSAKKYTHFIKLMGRAASHIALECALKTHPNFTMIGEEVLKKKATLSQVVHQISDVISQRANRGKNYGVILIPEGIIEFIPEFSNLIQEINQGELSAKGEALMSSLPPSIVDELNLARDPHGNVRVSQIETEKLLVTLVEAELKQRASFKGKFSPVHHFFGYEGRSGFPSNFDANYTYALGMTAVTLIDRGFTGYMSSIGHLTRRVEEWTAGGVPLTMMMCLEKRKGEMKPVIQKTMVDLEGEPFRYFAGARDKWALEEHYRYQGPIQYFGPSNLCNETTFTLKLEQNVPVPI